MPSKPRRSSQRKHWKTQRDISMKFLSLVVAVVAAVPKFASAQLPASCTEVYEAGGTADGIYTVSPSGAGSGVEVYCDQTTDGGGWMLTLAYKRTAGDDFLPLVFDTIPTDPAAGFSHVNVNTIDAGGYSLFDITDVRFYCTSSRTNRVMNFKTSNDFVRSLAFNGDQTGNAPSEWTTGFTALTGHDASLPGTTSNSNPTVPVPVPSLGLTELPFRDSVQNRFWAIGADAAQGGLRWECDDFFIGGDANTVHQVYVRMGTPVPQCLATCSDLAELDASVTQQGTDLDAVEATVTQQGNDLDAVEATVQQQGVDLAELSATVMQQGVVEVTSCAEVFEEVLSKLINTTQHAVEATVMQQGNDLDAVEATITQQGSYLGAINATVTQQGNDLGVVQQQAVDLAILESTVDQLNTTVLQQAGDLATLESTVDQLNTTVLQQAGDLASLESTVDQLNTTVQALLDALDAYKSKSGGSGSKSTKKGWGRRHRRLMSRQ